MNTYNEGRDGGEFSKEGGIVRWERLLGFVLRRRFLCFLALVLLLALGLTALLDYRTGGRERKSMVFRSADGTSIVEQRMLPRRPDAETEIADYVREFLLGPITTGYDLPFPRETGLLSLMYREHAVYLNLNGRVLVPTEGVELRESFRVLYAGILRNFPEVREVLFFIDGRAAFVREFGN
ncbi:MAG: GerMN domain-containing protein [Treponema sp.]|nr:GerMN domain-containing protein [Treponema sp.]